MNRIHKDDSEPKYKNGKWSWDSKKEKLNYEPFKDLVRTNERYIYTHGHKFLRTLNQEEELIYRQDFVRHSLTFDADVIVINDIRDLVLFMMPQEFLSIRFLKFMHRPAVHRLLHALIIYFEYFIQMVEFLLIRRDELGVKNGQIQSEQTNDMKRMFSIYLSQYRMLVARNYAEIITGEGEMQEFYHIKPIVNISATTLDRVFYEQFFAVTTQIVWICMHRRAYYVIEMEIDRLFRTEHFIKRKPEYLTFSPAEKSLLYGRNNKIVNYRAQISPLMQELKNVSKEDQPILWIGERKYRGTDERIAELELEYITPGPQLRMINVFHGILGHPKRLYNTILELDWSAVRFSNYSEQHDPYHIIRQPQIRIPSIDEANIRKMAKHYDHFFRVYRIYEPISDSMLNKWFKRDDIIEYYRSGGVVKNVWTRCKKDVENKSLGPSVKQIKMEYEKKIAKMRKWNSLTLEEMLLLKPQASSASYLFKKKPKNLRDDHYFVN